jgi:hypothetical protein
MARTQLDAALLKKMAKKLRKTEQYIREQISRRASKLSIASEAAQVLWAKELGLGTAGAQRRLDPHIQQQISSAAVHVPARSNGRAPAPPRNSKGKRKMSDAAGLTAAIDLLLSDSQLKQRTGDLLKARKNFDRVFREATTVFDDRLQKRAQLTKVNPSGLVAQTLNPNKPILQVSKYTDEQQGFFLLCSGLMAAFRNPAHHTLNDKLTREDALRFCGFVDSLLTIIAQATVIVPSQTTASGANS